MSSSIVIDTLRVRAACGAQLFEAFREAASLAFSENRPVVLVHNAKEIEIYPNKIFVSLCKEQGVVFT